MRVRVHVRDEVIPVECGEGNQRIKWLAMVSLQRYESTIGERQSQKHVATGLTSADGTPLLSNKIIARVLDDEAEVYVRVQEDDKIGAGPPGLQMPLGTSAFLASQGASAVRCSLSGRGVGHVLVGETTHLFVVARDTYGNLARNGGDVFNLRAEGPGTVTSSIRDLDDGSYHLAFACSAVGQYSIHVLLEGLNIDGSPFSAICTRKPEISRLKWNQPTLTGAPPHAVACGVSVAIGRRVLLFGGTAGGDQPSNAIRVLHTERMKWMDAAVSDGPSPPPCFAAASALISTRLFVYGGEQSSGLEPSARPLDCLWVFDFALTDWRQLEAGGIKPGARSFSAAAAIGNTLYLFGGWNGTAVTNSLHTLHTSAGLAQWEPALVSPASASVRARMGHSMAALGEKLYVYGGRAADTEAPDAVYADVAIYDPGFRNGGMWSIAKTGGEVPRERWLHSCVPFGERLVVFGGYDASGESNTFSILSSTTLAWDSWDASASRAGAMLHVVDGRALAIGGVENGLVCDDVLEFNLGGFELLFDGERDEVMVPHPPTLLPAAYTIEAWICPARVGGERSAMNILCRSNDSYPTAVWSHQLRLNERGKLQHCTLLAMGERVVLESNSSIRAGAWTHVAGSASSDGSMAIFINGQDDDVPEAPISAPLNAQLDRIFIGAKAGDGMGMFAGVIAEVRVWSSARTAEQVKEDMKRVRARARGHATASRPRDVRATSHGDRATVRSPLHPRDRNSAEAPSALWARSASAFAPPRVRLLLLRLRACRTRTARSLSSH
jgi:N-acetylneuraminic acid mutarotase